MDILQKERNIMKVTKILKEPRVIILLAFLLISFIAIGHRFDTEGVTITSIELNSTAYNSGMRSPTAEVSPTEREVITLINNQKINDLSDFNKITNEAIMGSEIRISTNKGVYALEKDSENLGITTSNVPSTNLRKGLDLQGGTRVLLRPVDQITEQQLKDVISTMEQRLNVYGLTDLTIKAASDLEGNKFIVIEIAGVTKEEVKELIAKQGKFEAKIGNETIFEGNDVTFVCRTGGNCVNLVQPVCPPGDAGYSCRFEFEVHLSQEAAEKHQQITKNLKVTPGTRSLEKNIDFYLDGQQVDSLGIDQNLKGIKATRITISGGGSGETVKSAIKNTIENKNKLQTFLITGSLPTKLEIEKIDTLSPTAGESFIKNAVLLGIIALIIVSLIIYIRYRSLKTSLPIIVIMLSETYLILGFAAVFKQNLDLAAIAGIIASVGTGVNDQIVIIDEIRRGVKGSLKQNVKKAFFVIMASYVTAVAAMIPLLRAGAGLLTGFAVVNIIGITVGILITRPAFAAILRVLMEE